MGLSAGLFFLLLGHKKALYCWEKFFWKAFRVLGSSDRKGK